MPLTVHEPEWGFNITVCGPENEYGNVPWSLPTLDRPQEDEGRQRLVTALADTFSKKPHIQTVYAPCVKSNAVITESDSLRAYPIRITESCTLYRNPNVPADGTFLECDGEAFIASAAGRPIIIATAKDLMIVAHAGRDSLIDPAIVMDKMYARKHPSILDAILEAFRARDAKLTPDTVTMRMLLAIPSSAYIRNLNHPVHGKYNRALQTFLKNRYGSGIIEDIDDENFSLNLEGLFMVQTVRKSVGDASVGKSLNKFPFLAHTYDGKDPSRQNLIIIERTY